jgi:hypothetical protein
MKPGLVVISTPVILTSAAAVGLIAPTPLLDACPVSSKVMPTLIVGVPSCDVATCESGVTLAAALVVTDPELAVITPTVDTVVFASAVGAIDPTALVAV